MYYRRLFCPVDRELDWATRILIVFVIVYSTCALFIFAFMCNPICAFWDIRRQTSTACPSVNGMLARLCTTLSLHVATDIIILLLPMKVVYKLNLSKRQKAVLVLLFGAGAMYVIFPHLGRRDWKEGLDQCGISAYRCSIHCKAKLWPATELVVHVSHQLLDLLITLSSSRLKRATSNTLVSHPCQRCSFHLAFSSCSDEDNDKNRGWCYDMLLGPVRENRRHDCSICSFVKVSFHSVRSSWGYSFGLTLTSNILVGGDNEDEGERHPSQRSRLGKFQGCSTWKDSIVGGIRRILKFQWRLFIMVLFKIPKNALR